jgi:plastocyanin
MTRTRKHLVVTACAVAGAIALLAPRARSRAAAGVVDGQVTITTPDGKPRADRAGVVVSIEHVHGGRPKPVKAEMRQEDKQFAPRVLVVTKGSTVTFPNEDKIFHNVFSLSPAGRFDLGLYKRGTAKTVTFRRAGEVDVFCNIHPEMTAKIKVVDTKYWAMTGADGSFHIDGVPPGTYPVEAWLAHGDPWKGTVTVTARGTAHLAIALVASDRHVQHTRKDGTPYGRYK